MQSFESFEEMGGTGPLAGSSGWHNLELRFRIRPNTL